MTCHKTVYTYVNHLYIIYYIKFKGMKETVTVEKMNKILHVQMSKMMNPILFAI